MSKIAKKGKRSIDDAGVRPPRSLEELVSAMYTEDEDDTSDLKVSEEEMKILLKESARLDKIYLDEPVIHTITPITQSTSGSKIKSNKNSALRDAGSTGKVFISQLPGVMFCAPKNQSCATFLHQSEEIPQDAKSCNSQQACNYVQLEAKESCCQFPSKSYCDQVCTSSWVQDPNEVLDNLDHFFDAENGWISSRKNPEKYLKVVGKYPIERQLLKGSSNIDSPLFESFFPAELSAQAYLDHLDDSHGISRKLLGGGTPLPTPSPTISPSPGLWGHCCQTENCTVCASNLQTYDHGQGDACWQSADNCYFGQCGGVHSVCPTPALRAVNSTFDATTAPTSSPAPTSAAPTVTWGHCCSGNCSSCASDYQNVGYWPGSGCEISYSNCYFYAWDGPHSCCTESNLRSLNSSYDATNAPTSAPSRVPTQQPTIQPSVQPTSVPTVGPTNLPTVRPSTSLPTVIPSRQPSFVPSGSPVTVGPSLSPSTLGPSSMPTVRPTSQLTFSPATENPTVAPTMNPSSRGPTLQPSSEPSKWPTFMPTVNPETQSPSHMPSAPVFLTFPPTEADSIAPTVSPSSFGPSLWPSRHPSVEPSVELSRRPTSLPTLSPETKSPSHMPSAPIFLTFPPTEADSIAPTISPSSFGPSLWPSRYPTLEPSNEPSVVPTEVPSLGPTLEPSRLTMVPSGRPSVNPTAAVVVPTSKAPTPKPSFMSATPSDAPSPSPTRGPSKAPSFMPTRFPSVVFTMSPSENWSLTPTGNYSSLRPSQMIVISTSAPSIEGENFTRAEIPEKFLDKDILPLAILGSVALLMLICAIGSYLRGKWKKKRHTEYGSWPVTEIE